MRSIKITFLGLLLAVALILSYIESLIPFYFGIPGMKLGLANLAVVLTLYCCGTREALGINILRVTLAGFLFGNLYTLGYSLAGALISFAAMLLMKKLGRFSIIGVSIGGGVCHNLGQVVVAMLVIETTGVLYYIPLLLLSGLITGALIGVAAVTIRPYIRIEERK